MQIGTKNKLVAKGIAGYHKIVYNKLEYFFKGG